MRGAIRETRAPPSRRRFEQMSVVSCMLNASHHHVQHPACLCRLQGRRSTSLWPPQRRGLLYLEYMLACMDRCTGIDSVRGDDDISTERIRESRMLTQNRYSSSSQLSFHFNSSFCFTSFIA